MERAKRRDLDIRLVALSAMMKTSLKINTNAQGYRIETADGNRDLSPRGTLRQTLDWVDAGIAVMTNLARG